MLAFPASPAAAGVEEPSALAAYVRARVADSAGASAEAAKRYAAALALEPDNAVLAARALSQAIAAGDRPLALRAARVLDLAGKLSPDGRLLLVAEAFREKKWAEADGQIAKIGEDEVFGFLAPILGAWRAQGSGKGDPLALLAPASASPLGKSYADEQQAFLLLARGRRSEALAALAPFVEGESLRAQRLRIAAAASLARKDRKAALALLEGGGDAVAAARRRLAGKQRLTGDISTPTAATAELLTRMAVDLNGDQVPELALSFARLATLIAPENGAAAVIAAELLSARGRHDAALDILSRVPAADPFAGSAAERRVTTLVAAGRRDEALKEARSAAQARPELVESWTRLGDVLSEAQNHGEAAEAYAKAVALAKGGAEAVHPLWALHLLHGSALTQAGRWPEGKAALEEANRLDPAQAVVLNFLGYSQLERRENLPEAERLIREASRLQPDNAAITDSLGWALYVRGQVKEAIELLERAARGQPADPAIAEHLGDAYYSAGRRFEARHAWQAALPYAEGPAVARLTAKIETGLRPELAAP